MLKRILSSILTAIILLSSPALGVSAAPADDIAVSGLSDKLAATAETAMPLITRVNTSANGAKITWTAFDGAARYAVFMQKPAGGWKTIGTTDALTFEHKKLTNNTTYIYTVRAMNADGKFISDYNRKGYSFRYFAPPALQSVTSIVGGQRLSWKAVAGATAYMVYVRYSTGWKPVSKTTATTYLNTNVTSGKQYTYTVRCCNMAGNAAESYFDTKGISGVYIAAPKITGYSPVSGGFSVSWDKVAGAARYGFFVKQSGKWKRLGATDKTSYTHTGLTGNTVYTYTVRCIDKNGSFCSGYDTAGVSFRYLAPPEIAYVSGKRIAWTPVAYAEGYSFYRKEFGKSWVLLSKGTELSFTDNTAKSNTLYTYTVRCLDANSKLSSYFIDSGKYYVNGALANGKYTVGGKSVSFTNGVQIKQGYVTIDGKMYYYNADGVLQKNGLVGTAALGYRYADKNGVVNLTYTGLAKNSAGTWYLKNGTLDRTRRAAISIGGVDYNILDGKAYKVSTEKDKTLNRALKLVEKVTKTTMTKSQKLKAVWNHLRTSYGERNPRIPHYHGTGWAETYANDIFVNGTGNCFSYGAAFAYMAKAIGYKNCYACNSGGHGWAEVDGLVYDPEWSMHNSHYTYYGMTYTEPCDVKYKSAISRGEWWMHVAVG